jgi:alkylation response protein AidB-like acyl-CoA dehydrogenase
MPEFTLDMRDIKFALIDQAGLERLCKYPKFSDLDRDTALAILDEAARLARQQFAPMNAAADREGASYDKATSQVRVPRAFHEAYKLYRAGGWVSLTENPEWGGQGMPECLHVAASDCFFGGCLSLSVLNLLTLGVGQLIEQFGNDELRRLYLTKLFSGQWAGTMCLTEPSAGSDVGASRTRARREGDHYLLEGEKIFITFGDHDLTENICHAVLARVEGAPAGSRGLSLFLVPKRHVRPDGSLGERNDVRCAGIEHKLGIHGSPTCSMIFGEHGRCHAYLLGEENKGLRAMFRMMNAARIAVGLQGAALANAAYQYALQFAKERVQGKALSLAKDDGAPSTAIINHPDVRRMLLGQKAYSEGLRALLIRTAFFIDLAAATDDSAERDTYNGLAELLTPVCKAYAADMGFRSVELSMQTLGGCGYINEYPIEQYLRDNKIASIYEGTNGIQALDLIGRKLPAKGGASLRAFIGMIVEFGAKHAKHPVLAESVALLATAREALVEASMYFAQVGGESPELPALYAYPYLELFGTVALGWLLLEQATLAYPRLAAIAKAKGVELGDARAVAKLCEADEEARFYDGKVKVARFYAHQALATCRGRAEVLKSGDTSALEASL